MRDALEVTRLVRSCPDEISAMHEINRDRADSVKAFVDRLLSRLNAEVPAPFQGMARNKILAVAKEWVASAGAPTPATWGR